MFKLLLLTTCFSVQANELKRHIEQNFTIKEINGSKGLCKMYKENGGKCSYRPDSITKQAPTVPDLSQIIMESL